MALNLMLFKQNHWVDLFYNQIENECEDFLQDMKSGMKWMTG